ncbi:hypothetical protein JRC04_22965 [Mycolicibacterium sp. S2-37]|uniref:hypothetical protein n=1 Tax=Mycolicibacterium sp. S2-37 TaxID=2810297 RepID=UPI001A9488E8|nr:hypothetical protein [Mycolicibacterium sp. S2-37]MBO0680337.1 hypothetical protein [Mycolicibacterium sp. S2-37]
MTTPTAAPTTGPAEEVGPAAIADDTETAPQTDAGESDDGDKPKGVRAKIDALEGERDGLRAQLDAAHAQAFDRAVESLGLRPELMRAAGLSVADHLTEGGAIDVDGLLAAADSKRAELGLPRAPRPNPVAGRNREEALGSETRSLGQILKETVCPTG